jgi:hypothetical protein
MEKKRIGRPSRAFFEKAKKDLFENWFGWGYSDTFIVQHSQYGTHLVAKARKLWEDSVAVETDFVTRQETARNNAVATLDKIIHELQQTVEKFKGNLIIQTKQGPMVNIAIASLLQAYYDKIAKWTMIRNGVLASKTVSEKLEDVIAQKLKQLPQQT